MSRTKLLDHALLENQVMAEMAALVAADMELDDMVHGMLDLVERLVLSPLLSLSIRETGQARHYARTAPDVDPLWEEEVLRSLKETWEPRLASGIVRPAAHHHMAPGAWFVAFPAESRSGRVSILGLGSPQLLSIEAEEEQLMLRLARQLLLVLEHAMLLRQVEVLEGTDRLTGLAAHSRLLEILDYEIQQHRYFGKRLALLLLDVEGLGAINRSYGHHYGNHILKRLADLLQETVRPVDVVARHGLDEFAVVLPETDEEEGQQLAEELRERLLTVEFAGGAIGLSLGVAHMKPDESLTAEGLLRRGEQALHEAKRQDRVRNALWQGGTARVRR